MRDFISLVRSDLYRHNRRISWRAFLYDVLFYPGFKYSFLMRCGTFLQHKRYLWPIYLTVKWLHRHYTFRYGISIPFNTDIGAGFYIGHFGGIFISRHAKIGCNCNVSQGVTIGKANRGKRAGHPVIGDQVYIGPGAKIIGKIRIGSNVAIGANCVVVDDVPDNAVVIGIPGRVVSANGSAGYVTNIWSGDGVCVKEQPDSSSSAFVESVEPVRQNEV